MIREALVLTEAMKKLNNYSLYYNDKLTYLYQADEELKEALDNYDTEGMDGKILLVFGVKEEMYIDAIWAQKGFGPLAYMLAMQISPSGWLAPNWNRSKITKSAEQVWKQFFDGKGSKLVTKELLHEAMEPDNMFNFKYKLKNKLNTSKNQKADRDFVGTDKFGEVRGMLSELAEGNLRHSMRSIY